METKQCTKCKEVKEANHANYSPSANRKGWQSWCRKCHREVDKNRVRVRNTPEDRARSKASRERYKQALADGVLERPTHKECRQCHKVQSQEFFGLVSSKDGLDTYCKACRSVRESKRYAKAKLSPDFKEVRSKQSKQYRDARKLSHWWEVLYETAKFNSAPARSLTFNLPDPQFILDLWERQKGLCHWFGVEMAPSRVNHDPQQPSLERLDCTRGYETDNVVLCCHAANRGRGNQSQQVWADFCNKLRS